MLTFITLFLSLINKTNMKFKSPYHCLMAIVASAALFLTSCTEEGLEIDFPLEYGSIFLEIDSTNQVGTKTLDSIMIGSVLDSVLQKENVKKDQIKSIKLESADFQVMEPTTGNFNSLHSTEAFLSAPGMSETKIAYKDNVADGLSKIELDINKDAELVDFMKAPSFTLRAIGTNDAPIPQMKIKVKIKYKVKATL